MIATDKGVHGQDDACRGTKAPDPALRNLTCFCITLNQRKLAQSLDAPSGEPGFHDRIAASHPHLFQRAGIPVRPLVASHDLHGRSHRRGRRIPAFGDAVPARARRCLTAVLAGANWGKCNLGIAVSAKLHVHVANPRPRSGCKAVPSLGRYTLGGRGLAATGTSRPSSPKLGQTAARTATAAKTKAAFGNQVRL